jgi:chromate reductase
VRILGVCGSLRRDSHNTRLLRRAGELLPADVELVEYDRLKLIPPFDEDDEPAPGPEVEAWRAEIADADGLLFATPEYNSSIPGQLKNAIDWASRPFDSTVIRNKPAAVIGASSSMFGAVWSQAELRKALGAAGARVLDRELAVRYAQEAFDEHGRLADRDLELELEGILAELIESVREREALRASRPA